jgi:hypothetical protein
VVHHGREARGRVLHSVSEVGVADVGDHEHGDIVLLADRLGLMG